MSSSDPTIVALLKRAEEAIATLMAVHAKAESSPTHKMPECDVASFQQAHSALLDLKSMPLDLIETRTIQIFTKGPSIGSTPTVPGIPATASDAFGTTPVSAPLAVVEDGKKQSKNPRKKKKKNPKAAAPPKKEKVKKRKRRADVRLFTFAEDGFECALVDDGCKNPHETTKRRPHPLPPDGWYTKEDGSEMTAEEKLNKRVCHSCYSKYWYRKNKAKADTKAAADEKRRKKQEVRDEALAIIGMDALGTTMDEK